MTINIARITWSDNVWQKPSGSKRGHESDKNFTVESGYGHEEWLFSNIFQYNEFAYGFVRGASNSSKSRHGKVCDVMLYTVSKSDGWYVVGEIKNCYIITEEDAAEAVEFFRKNKLLDKMKADVASVSGSVEKLVEQFDNPRSLFSVKFKPEDLKIYKEFKRIDRSSPIRGKYNRYQLNEVSNELEELLIEYKVSEDKKTSTLRTQDLKEIEIQLLHNQMQDELESIFKKKFDTVLVEYNNIDIFIEDGEQPILCEIKTDSSARMCIRKALGQILEYALYENSYPISTLLIIGPAPLKEKDLLYLDLLNSKVEMKIMYRQYEVGSNVIPI